MCIHHLCASLHACFRVCIYAFVYLCWAHDFKPEHKPPLVDLVRVSPCDMLPMAATLCQLRLCCERYFASFLWRNGSVEHLSRHAYRGPWNMHTRLYVHKLCMYVQYPHNERHFGALHFILLPRHMHDTVESRTRSSKISCISMLCVSVYSPFYSQLYMQPHCTKVTTHTCSHPTQRKTEDSSIQFLCMYVYT